MKNTRLIVIIITIITSINIYAGAETNQPQQGWWPSQKFPKKIYVCSYAKDESNLAQSVSGVVAQALNEGETDEAIWLQTNTEGYPTYLNMLEKRIGAKNAGTLDVWQLIKRYSKKSVIKGYVLFNQERGDASVNEATVKCGLLRAVMIDVSQENEAIRYGLVKLGDVTKSKGITPSGFMKISPKLNPNLLVLANPKVPNNRDYAIAHKAMVHYGVDSLLTLVLSWMKPLSPVIGWNDGPEFNHIAPCSRWGMINTASDWCLNLPLISCTTGDIKKNDPLDFSKVNWNEKKNYHSYVMSDGDNMQWTFSNFIFGPEYFSNQYNSDLSMSFTTCAVNLSMAAQDVWETILNKKMPHTAFVEYGGGYYYPDLFGKNRPDREKLLRELAQTINIRMQETGVRVFGFICKDIFSKESQTAYQIFAEEIDPLAGMIAVQYSPYNGGHGEIIWVKNKRGESIPVVSAKYQIWSNLDQKGSGNPAKISANINMDSKSDASVYSWSIVHAWSNFGLNQKNEVFDSKTKQDNTQRGVTPLTWGKELLNKDVKLVNIEELLWRIRMENYPQQTLKYIQHN